MVAIGLSSTASRNGQLCRPANACRPCARLRLSPRTIVRGQSSVPRTVTTSAATVTEGSASGSLSGSKQLESGWPLLHCIEAQQFTREMLDYVFETADEMEAIAKDRRHPGAKMMEGKVMATLFYEPSTRTRLSFEGAMMRLGGYVLSTESAGEYSSAAKGETLEDTIRTVEGYADCIVLRHFLAGSAKRAAMASSIPIINAGDGPGQHPTQALLDVYTIWKELGQVDDVVIGLVGDLAHGRTVRSLAYLLGKCYNNVKFYFVAPDVVKMKDDIKSWLTDKGIEWEEVTNLADVAGKCNVLYQTRIQKERFLDNPEDYDSAKGMYVVDKAIMDALPKDAIVMHPLPRVDEITTDVDSDPRAAYFRQAQNGLYVRMALLKILLLDSQGEMGSKSNLVGAP